jgi:hypothetical protein
VTQDRSTNTSLEARLSRAAKDLDGAAERYETWGRTTVGAPRRRPNFTRFAVWGATVASVMLVTTSVWVAKGRVGTNTSVVEAAAAPSTLLENSAEVQNERPQQATEKNAPIDTFPEVAVPPGPYRLSNDPNAPAPEIRFQLKTISELVISDAGTGPHVGWFRARKGQTIWITPSDNVAPADTVSDSLPTNKPSSNIKSKSSKSSGPAGTRVRTRVITVTSRDTGERVGEFQVPGSDTAVLPTDGTYTLSLEGDEAFEFQLQIK